MRISDWSSDVCSSDLALNDIIPQVTQLQIGCDLLALRPPNKRSSPGFRRHFDYRLVEQERTGPLSHASLIVRVTKLGVGGVKENQRTGDRQKCKDPVSAERKSTRMKYSSKSSPRKTSSACTNIGQHQLQT